MSEHNDDLMRRIQGADEADKTAAFTELVTQWEGPIIGFCQRKLHDYDLARDIAQEAFLRVWSTAATYAPSGRFKSWLYRITRNLIVDSVRRRKGDVMARRVSNDADGESDLMSMIADVSETPDAFGGMREFADKIDDLLPLIPDDQRSVFVLYACCGMSLPEIASAMEANLPTTKSRLRLAREKLRERLESRGIVAEMLMAW